MSWAIWITGLPGSGKSALARALAGTLRARGERVVVLELDALRKILTPSPTYSDGERNVVYRALVYLATTLTESGVPVIIDATGHRRQWRDLARASIPDFAEVQLVCPIEVCRERERHRTGGNAPRGIYAAAGRPSSTVPGVDVPYEAALATEAVVDTTVEGVAMAAERLVKLARALAAAAPPAPEVPGPRWAIWITGLPGSGKTTLASSVAEALAARGVRVRLLELPALREFLLPGASGWRAEEEIVYRTLVYTAVLLTESGVPVIIDATAPRRVWREIARELIAHFAEVQLVCPAEVCGARERAGRWNLTLCPQAGHRRSAPAEAPDLVVSYEYSLNPDVTLDTSVHDVWGAADEVLRLAARLHRTATTAGRVT